MAEGARVSRVLLALVVLHAPAFAQQRAVTIDDVLNLKSVGAAAVSPDGTQVLYTVRQWETERDRMESRTRIWKVPVGRRRGAPNHLRRTGRFAAAVVA